MAMSITTPGQSKNNQSSLVQLDSKGDIQWVSHGPTPIQLYAAALWEALSEKDTAITYKQALIKTWVLFKYLLALVFFSFLFVIAFIISIWGIGFNLGKQFRQWLDDTENDHGPNEIVEALLKILFLPLQKAVELANKYIARYFPGWEPLNIKFFESTEEEDT
jgi:hypothetical protein